MLSGRPTVAARASFLLVAGLVVTEGARSTDEAGPPGVDDLLSIRLSADEAFRIVRLSEAAYYVQFASSEARAAVFEGFAPELMGPWAGRLSLTMPGEVLAGLYARMPDLAGAGGEFRDALVAAGFFPLDSSVPRRVLITMIETEDLGQLYDFSLSETAEAATEREEGLRRLKGDSVGETGSLSHWGADHPSVATFELWRFDDLPAVLEAAESREAAADRIEEARRARFLTETIRALYWADPAYESAVLDWIERDLDQADVNLLAQMLQIAGFPAIDSAILVRESAPHLYDPDVIRARLFQRLEGLTVEVGRKGARRLDPDQFASEEVLGQAQAFYSKFFATDEKGRLEFELREEVSEFVNRHSRRIQEISDPFLKRLLADLPVAKEAPPTVSSS